MVDTNYDIHLKKNEDVIVDVCAIALNKFNSR